MQRARSGAFRLLVTAGVSLAVLSCSKDEIPTTPPSPFLFTGVQVSKFVTPSAATILQKGRSYIAKFDVAYTLSPADDAQRSSLEVMAVVSSHDANGSFLSVIGSLAYTPPQLTAAGGVVTDSIGFTVPSNASFISVGAGIVARGGSISNGGEIGPYWSVQ